MIESTLLHTYLEQPDVWDEMFGTDGIRFPYKNFVTAIADPPPIDMTHKDATGRYHIQESG